ncbi:MAG: TolC family protein [Verrucomicrobiota bacterium]
MNFPRIIPFALSALLVAGAASEAGAPLELSLSKAIQLAMEKNLAIKVEAFNPQIADARATTKLGAFDPELRGGFTQQMNRTANDAESQTGAFSAGVGGMTPLGSSYSLGLNTNALDYSGYNSGAGVSLTQPLLRGFGTDVNLASLRIARNNRQGSGWAFRQQVIDVVTQTVYVYNELYAAQRNYEAARRSRELALQFVKDECDRVEAGVKTKLDVVTAQAEAAAREEAVILAQSAIEDNERLLKQLVTDDTQTLLSKPISIVPPPTPAITTVDVEAGLRDAFRERPDYQQALLDLKNRHITVITARNQTLPRLDLVGSLNLLGVTGNNAGSSYDFFGDSSSDPNNWAAGVVLRIPIGNRTARGGLTEAKLLNAQALVGLHGLEQRIIVEVANAASGITTSRKRIDSTLEALRLAKESLQAGQTRNLEGAATPFEVLELQKKLMEAEAAEIRAESDYRKAISEYHRRTGVTLERNSITISETK